MRKVINFQKTNGAYPSADTDLPKPSRTGRQFVLALVRTPFTWISQILPRLLAILVPIFNAHGQIMIACMIFMTLIEWGNKWKHTSLLWIPPVPKMNIFSTG